MSGSLGKALTLLRHLSAAESGLRLTDLAGATGVPAASAHRLLKTLQAEGFVARAPGTRAWRLGDSAAALSGAAWRQFPLRRLAEPVLVRLTRETELTSYLSVVSGRDALCLLRIDGSGEVRTLTMDAGTRRPLGVGAGAMALLAALPEAEAQKAIAGIAADPPQGGRGFDARSILAACRLTRHQGHAEHQGTLIAGLCGMGVAGVAQQRPFAVSVSFIGSLLGEERRARTRRLLQGAVAELERLTRDAAQPTN